MSYLTTVPESDADDDLIAIHATAEQAMGYVHNYTRTSATARGFTERGPT